MSNIKVDLSTPIFDGAEVKFRSPADCSQVTGLVVCYNGESQEFIFADAHGNNVGDIDHLFTEDVVVKVILDVTKGMAFVQNADTNAYLEGRFAELEDMIGTGGGGGADGFSPIATVTQTDSGATITITDKNGTTTATVTNGKDGVDGKDGADGYSPVKGTDYWTEADKAEMVADVIASLPVYDGSVV